MDVSIVFTIISAVIAIGFFANYFFKKTKIPDILWLIIFGLLIGPGLGLIDPNIMFQYFPLFSALALLLILFEGGSNINIYKLIRESFNVFLLTFSGFIFSTIFVSVFAHFIMDLSWPLSLLLGSIIGGTSSTIVIPMLENVRKVRKVKEEMTLVLKMESILTDPFVIITSLVILQAIVLNSISINTTQLIITKIMSLLSISIVFGFVSGVVWAIVWRKFVNYKYHYMLTIGFLFFIYVLSEFLGGNGAIASFMIGLVLGNISQVRKMLNINQPLVGLNKETREFNSYITFFVRTFFFAFMGIMISLSKLNLILYGLIISFILLIARYIVVQIVTSRMNLTKREKLLMTFLYPRGLAAAVLASIPSIQYNLPGTEEFPEIVFTVIVVTVLISTVGVGLIEKK